MPMPCFLRLLAQILKPYFRIGMPLLRRLATPGNGLRLVLGQRLPRRQTEALPAIAQTDVLPIHTRLDRAAHVNYMYEKRRRPHVHHDF